MRQASASSARLGIEQKSVKIVGSESHSLAARVAFVLALFATALSCLVSGASEARAQTQRKGVPRGYVVDVQNERNQVVEELVWVRRPDEGTMLRDRIFNETLSREFKRRYEERFGQTEIEQVFLSANRFSYYNDVYSVKGTPEDLQNERRQFGEFMIRRLTEWHVDNYAKNDPQVRVVWEAKEKLSNLKMEVASFRVDAQYSIAGNILDIKMVNPWVQSKVVLMMNPNQFGPGKVEETLLSVVKPVNNRYTVEGRWKFMDGVVSLIQYRPIGRVWRGSLTMSTTVHDAGKTPRESLVLAGLTRHF